MTYPQIATLTAPVSVPDHRWATAEDASSAASSASSKNFLEDIRIFTVVVAKLKLREIERQVLLANVVVRPDDSAFQKAPKPFNRVCVDLAANVLAFAMRDGIVRESASRQVVIAGVFVGRNQIDVAANRLADEAVKSLSICVLDHLADNVSLSADCSDDGCFADSATSGVKPFIPVFVLFLAANIGFVNFDFAHQLRESFILHRGADALTHEPSRPVIAATDHPMDLQSADTLLALTHQVDDLEPDCQRVVGILENRLSDDAESITIAPAAILVLADPVEGFGLKQIDRGVLAARTLDAIGPTHIAEQSLTGIFTRKIPLQLCERDVGLSSKRLASFDLAVHADQYKDFLDECQA